ncbi:MAG: hypothetical protein KF686_15710 [Ramlibacter sp.]|nr:hypothetical protein [Ramlibacter sp.]
MEKLIVELILGALKQFSPLELIRAFRGDKVRRLREALENPNLSSCTRELLEEELNFALARENVGVVGSRLKREKILSLVKQSNGELLIGHVARASSRLAIKTGKLVADLTETDRRGLLAGTTLSFFVVASGTLVLMSPVILQMLGQGIGVPFGLILMAWGVMLSLFGIFMMAQLDPLRMAFAISPQLAQLQANDSPPTAAIPSESETTSAAKAR